MVPIQFGNVDANSSCIIVVHVEVQGAQDLVGCPNGTNSIVVSPHGVRSRRGVAFVSSVGASVAARSARCSRWLCRTVKLVY